MDGRNEDRDFGAGSDDDYTEAVDGNHTYGAGSGYHYEASGDSVSEAIPYLREVIRGELKNLLERRPSSPGRRERDTWRSSTLDEDSRPAGRRERVLATGTAAGDAPREDLSVKIHKFDPAETEWYSYRAHFLALAEQAAWSERTKTSRLMSSLQGSNTGVMAGMRLPITFQALLDRLDEIYGLANAKEDAVLKLQALKMEPQERLTLYAERVRQLVARAYPRFSEADRSEQALHFFLQGLPGAGGFRMQMRTKGFRSLAEAVEFGSRLEQIMQDERPRTQARAVGEEQGEHRTLEQMAAELTRWKETNAQLLQALQDLQTRPFGGRRGNFQCYGCGEEGHMKRNCPRLPPRRGSTNSQPTP